MKRRNFLRNASLAGMAMTSTPFPGNEHEAYVHDASNPPETFSLMEATISELRSRMQSGKLTSRAATQQYLQRIEAVDRKGPGLNSVIEVNPDALKIADRMDAERRAGKVRGPLHGIPILVKDNIDTADGMMTTAGSVALLGNKASKDAFCVARLREAGAVIIGKTNLSEWANFRSTKSSSGWSSRGGQTRNPYVLNRNPSGSSSGSGASVSANLCAVAVGTETDGSIIAPSSCCGIVGLKPTVGLVSRSGIIPISKTQDTAGPMTRTVADAAILLGAMTGVDPEDPATLASEGKAAADYTVYLKSDALAGKRIGIEKRFRTGNHFVVELYEKAIALLKSKGAEVVEVELLRLTAGNAVGELAVLQYEFKDGLNRYLAKANGKVKSLEELIRFNRENEAKTMPWFKQETLENSQKRGGLDSAEYLDALKKTTGAARTIDDLMKEQRLDAIAGTSYGVPGCTDPINGDYGTGFYFCQPSAIAGYPNITVPMGYAQGLPVGLSFIARAWEEGPLLGMAYAFEQASKHRVPPGFKPML